MKVNMQSVNFTVDRKLVDFIQRKMDKLENYYDKVIDSDIYLKVENTSAKENKIAEVRVNIPGDDIMVKKQCRTFEEAIDEATSTLQRALLKRKEKVRAH
ncbi:ribosome hibernation-promoting factor, HPF/YfiA family [Kordia sp.]|uniref:ribosome hibernation-promoting factor, HPF/YfiA family n=1 Tax=Kordia sp. TaxID=1965332 RepID=UPI003B5CCC15